MDCFADVNGIRIHYNDHGGGKPAILLLPGLTANARCFDGLIAAGLSPRFRVLALDLRGRGLSDKPASGYAMADHAADVVSLMDSVKLCDAVVGGHSFGGLLTLYMAAQYPERVSKLILLDSSGQIINPTSRSLIKPSLDRLGQTFPSWESYLDSIKAMPFYAGWWDPLIENYYRADVEYAIDGSVRPRSKREHISEAIDRAADEPWGDHIRSINQPAVLIRAPEGFGPAGSKPIVPLDHAMATVDALDDCRYVEAPGNHMTMLYGEGAREIVTCITEFISE